MIIIIILCIYYPITSKIFMTLMKKNKLKFMNQNLCMNNYEEIDDMRSMVISGEGG